MGQEFQLVFQGAQGLVVRQFDQDRVVLGRSLVCDVVFDSPHLRANTSKSFAPRTVGSSKICEAAWELPSTASGLTGRGSATVIGSLWRRTLPRRRSLSFTWRNPPTQRRPRQSSAMHRDRPASSPASTSANYRTLWANPARENAPRSYCTRATRRRTSSWLRMPPVGPSSKARPNLPVLSMFKTAGEILLADESLDAMLQQVVDLIAEHLPGRRGVVCMVDPASGEIQPRCFSTGDGPPAVSDQPKHLARSGPRTAGHARGQRRGRPRVSMRQPASSRWTSGRPSACLCIIKAMSRA